MSESLTIDLDEKMRHALVEIYVKENMRPESLEVFYDYLNAYHNTETAINAAVINEMVNSALNDTIKRAQFAEALNNNNNKEDTNDNIENS